jgi:ABC-type uncharacterized transport system involved in gliding motility auxiliary subunit
LGQLLPDLFATTSVAPDAAEIRDVDVLLVFGARGLQEKSLKAIDGFLAGGGKVFLAVDPRLAAKPEGEDNLSALAPLFKTWGVSVPAGKFAGDLQYAGVGRVNAFSPPQRLLPVFQCQGECLRATNAGPVAGLGDVTFVYPGVVQKDNLAPGLKLTTLIQTSPRGNMYEDSGFGLMSPQQALENFREGTAPLPIAVRLDGTFPRAYPDTKEVPNAKPGAVVLVADQDFVSNQFAFTRDFLGARPANDNVNFLLNGLDGLTGSPDLMDIRSKGTLARPFTTIRKIQLVADQESLSKVAEINTSINRFQAELAGLAGKATQSNLGVIQSEGLTKQKELQQNIARLKRELREAKRQGREKVEAIGSVLYFVNVGAVPLALAVIYLVSLRGTRKTRKSKGGKSYEYYDDARQPV